MTTTAEQPSARLDFTDTPRVTFAHLVSWPAD